MSIHKCVVLDSDAPLIAIPDPRMQSQERNIQSQLSTLVQGMQQLQLSLMSQVSQLSTGQAAEMQQVRVVMIIGSNLIGGWVLAGQFE